VITKQNDHQKHGKTTRARIGEFGRCEFAILGTPCGNIKKLANEIIQQLNKHRIAYIDAEHESDASEMPTAMHAGAEAALTNKIDFQRLDLLHAPNPFQQKILFHSYDLVLVNGNHANAVQQILIIDDAKPVQKKLHKITNPRLVLFNNENRDIPGELIKHDPTIENLPQFDLRETEKIADFIAGSIKDNIPELHGLVLAGGKSTRMKADKGKMIYHEKPQRDHLYALLSGHVNNSFISCRKDQQAELKDHNLIMDRFDELGPFGAILSAFSAYPDNAWLVVACDLPLIDKGVIRKLVEHRDPSKVATAYHNPKTGFPEPLITIWEPKAYMTMLQFLALGYSCPRKVLINSDTNIIEPENPDVLRNVNHPEEAGEIKKMINS